MPLTYYALRDSCNLIPEQFTPKLFVHWSKGNLYDMLYFAPIVNCSGHKQKDSSTRGIPIKFPDVLR